MHVCAMPLLRPCVSRSIMCSAYICHLLQDFMGDGAQVAVMTEADPNHCMMALINDRYN